MEAELSFESNQTELDTPGPVQAAPLQPRRWGTRNWRLRGVVSCL